MRALYLLASLALIDLTYGQGLPEAKISENQLRRVISAPFKLEGDVLTITYDWQKDTQINDFELVGPKPLRTTPVLQLEPGSALKHKVKFLDAFKMDGKMILGSRKGVHIESSSGLSISCSSYNAWFVTIFVKGAEIANEVFDPGYNKATDLGAYFPIGLRIDSGAVILNWDKVKIGGKFDGPFGHVILLGGSGGNKFGKLVISGVLDKEWAMEAIALANP